MQKEIIKLGLILFIISAISAGLLSVANNFTEKIIEQAKLEEEMKALAAIIPGTTQIEDADEAILSKIKESNKKFKNYSICKDDSGNQLGYAIKTLSTKKGYSDDIEVLVGISMEGKLVGISIIEHSETNGIGSQVEGEDYQKQFIGKSTENELKSVKEVKNDNEVQTIGGATYSSRSFTSAINNAFEVFNNFLK